MAYKVINDFIDIKDNNARYQVGDDYPRGDSKPSKKRLDELSQSHPKYKRSFIEEVKEETKPKGKSKQDSNKE